MRSIEADHNDVYHRIKATPPLPLIQSSRLPDDRSRSGLTIRMGKASVTSELEVATAGAKVELDRQNSEWWRSVQPMVSTTSRRDDEFLCLCKHRAGCPRPWTWGVEHLGSKTHASAEYRRPIQQCQFRFAM